MLSRKRLIVCLLLLITIVFDCSMDRSAVSYAVIPIQKTFGLSNAEFGLLVSVFSVGYLIMNYAGGVLADTLGVRRVLTFSVLLWSLAAILGGLSPSFFILLFSRFILGIAEGPTFPCYAGFIATHLSMNWRVRATSWGLAALPLALALGAPLVSQLVIHFDWRWSFILLGIAGAILAVLWFVIYRDPNVSTPSPSSPSIWKDMQCFRIILRNKNLVLNNFAFFAYGCTVFFAFSWLPDYFEQHNHLSLAKVGWYSILPWIVSTLLMLLGGTLSDFLWNRYRSLYIARSLLICIGLLLSVASFCIVLASQSLWVNLWGISFAIGFCFMTCPAFYSLNMDIEKNYPATSLGIMNIFFSLAGIISPPVIGWLSGMAGNFNSSIFLLMCISGVAALTVALWQRP